MPPSQRRWRLLFRRRQPVLSLAQRSLIGSDVENIIGKPHGQVVDMVIDELAAQGFFRIEPGYWGGVPAAARARELSPWDVERLETRREREMAHMEEWEQAEREGRHVCPGCGRIEKEVRSVR